MIVEIVSEEKRDVLGNVNIPMKKRRYVVTNSDFESEDIFTAKKMHKETLDNSNYGYYEGVGDEKFATIEEMYIEERDVRKELQEALENIEDLEELVQNYEQKEKWKRWRRKCSYMAMTLSYIFKHIFLSPR
jgi:molybdopterin converting factor small subunit